MGAGWVPYAYQIGQTGKKRIVAINRNEEAPILKMADLGVVGDLLQVLPALTEEVRKRQGS